MQNEGENKVSMSTADRSVGHDWLLKIDDVQITVTIKRQCFWVVELIWCVAFSVSANNNSALLCSFWPTYNTMIASICYIDCTWCIDEESLG